MSFTLNVLTRGVLEVIDVVGLDDLSRGFACIKYVSSGEVGIDGSL